ncbi:F-box/kelch-repeat protein [Quillaja saponaria]|uniref:F-box/kelch-repeat protein n=1 Tax=Quillaja saponaria TaxID=32244 RepID=A0AAD7QHA2_QUISA|nr:F-box/kelch-repeat protein [Quillaja saponaria]
MGSSSHFSHQNNNSSRNFRIYASFCSKNPSLNTNKSNWIECYNPSNNAWHRVSMITGLTQNQVLKGFSMVAIDGSIFVIGGRLCHKVVGHDSADDIVEVGIDVLSNVLRYDVHSDVWSKCAPLSTPRFDFAYTVYDNRIYVAGGKCTLASTKGVSSAEFYDPALDEWKPLPNMRVLRYKCVGVTWQGKIHVVGGFAGMGDSWYTLERSSAEVYDSEHAKWDLHVGMWQLDVPPNQIVAVDGKLFSSGDCLKSWKGHIEAYDEKLNIWNVVDGSYLQTLSSTISTSDENWPPMQQLYLTMASVGNHLYFLSGYRMPGEIPRCMSVVHVFDTSANGEGWRSFEPMEENMEKELCSHCCIVSY